jgi:hypothetical protein
MRRRLPMAKNQLFTLKVVGDKEIGRELERQVSKVERVKGEVYATSLAIQAQAKDNLRALGGIDVGNLVNSVTVKVVKGGLQAEIGPDAPYGEYVELGTRPHFPPVDPLEKWAHRHGMDGAGYLIARAISRRGTQPRPFLYPALFACEGEFYRRLARIMEG